MEQSPCPVVPHFLRVWNSAAKSGNTDLGSCPSGVILCSSALSWWKIPEHRERHSGSPYTSTSWWWSLGKSPTIKRSTRRRARQKDRPRSLSDGDYQHRMCPLVLLPHISKTHSMENSALPFSEAITTWNVSTEKSSLVSRSAGETPFLPSCMKVSDSSAGPIHKDSRDPTPTYLRVSRDKPCPSSYGCVLPKVCTRNLNAV